MTGFILPDLFVLAVERDLLSQRWAHSLDELVFNRLAELTDLRNGEIGFSSRISVARLASELSEEVERKSKGCRISVSRDQCLRSINRLVKFGLFDRRSQGKRLMLVRVFWRDFVSVCKSVQKADTTADTMKLSDSIKILSWIINDLHDYKKVIHRADTTADTTHNKPTTTMGFAKQIPKNKSFRLAMDLDFVFDVDTVQKILERYGFDYLKIDKRWEAGFVSHWWANGLQINWMEWHEKYCQKMAEYFSNPSLFDSLNGGALVKKPKLAGVRCLIPAVPRVDGDLSKFAIKHGFRDANVGELTKDFRRYLIGERMRRLDKKEKSKGLADG